MDDEDDTCHAESVKEPIHMLLGTCRQTISLPDLIEHCTCEPRIKVFGIEGCVSLADIFQ